MRQTHEKNRQDLQNFPWANLMKLATGSVVQQFFLNWLDSAAEGLLEDGKSIEEAIKELREKIATGGGGGEGNAFSDQFRLINELVHWDPAYIAAKYPTKTIEGNSIFTAKQKITDTTEAPFAVLQFQPQVNKILRCKGEFRLATDNGFHARSLDISYSNTSAGVLATLTSEFQELIIGLNQTSPKDAEYVTLSISEVLGSSVLMEQGTAIEMRNAVILDEEDNEIEVINVSTFLSNFSLTKTGQEIPNLLKGTRVQHLTLTTAGQTPTMPQAGLMPGNAGWLETDLMISEWAWNKVDDIWYYNNGIEIKPFKGNDEINANFSDQFKKENDLVNLNVTYLDAGIVDGIWSDTYFTTEAATNTLFQSYLLVDGEHNFVFGDYSGTSGTLFNSCLNPDGLLANHMFFLQPKFTDQGNYRIMFDIFFDKVPDGVVGLYAIAIQEGGVFDGQLITPFNYQGGFQRVDFIMDVCGVSVNPLYKIEVGLLHESGNTVVANAGERMKIKNIIVQRL
ncbi:hypothetical protein DMA11_10390 [Marinilabiliaceae bacterium JC017]|nr:hypothetical protein DMA11_10390 [Marinilabiliaceae bacterium JC017]